MRMEIFEDKAYPACSRSGYGAEKERNTAEDMLKSYIAFDLETTGLSPETNEIIEIGALKVQDGKVQERFMEFIMPSEPISARITEITGITNEMVADARRREEVIPAFLDFCGNEVLVGHNIIFDYSFMKNQAELLGLSFEKQGIDTLKIARRVHKNMESKSLEALCAHYEIDNKAAHRAYHDALATAKLYQTLAHYFEEREPQVFKPAPLNCSGKGRTEFPASPKQVAFLARLAAQKKIKINWNPETLTKSEASRLIELILSGGQP